MYISCYCTLWYKPSSKKVGTVGKVALGIGFVHWVFIVVFYPSVSFYCCCTSQYIKLLSLLLFVVLWVFIIHVLLYWKPLFLLYFIIHLAFIVIVLYHTSNIVHHTFNLYPCLFHTLSLYRCCVLLYTPTLLLLYCIMHCFPFCLVNSAA